MRNSRAAKIETINLVEEDKDNTFDPINIDWSDIEEVYVQAKSKQLSDVVVQNTYSFEVISDDESRTRQSNKDPSISNGRGYQNGNIEDFIPKDKRDSKSKFFKNRATPLTSYFTTTQPKIGPSKAVVNPSPEKRRVSVLNRTSSKKKYTYIDEKIPYNKLVSIEDNKGNTPGAAFSKAVGNNWFYLGSKNFRRYQFEIVETCLFYNTLVCLPTGLGKTYIATNVIYNYYQWFPRGKIFFLAPTKPLVTQQLASLGAIKGIDFDEVCELTGGLPVKKRNDLYDSKRIFFMTPQTLENDIKDQRLDLSSIVLIVFGKFIRRGSQSSWKLRIQKYQQCA